MLSTFVLTLFCAVQVAADSIALPSTETEPTDEPLLANSSLRRLMALDFSVSDAVGMTIDSTTDPDNWNLQLDFGYAGPGVDFVVGLLDSTSCATHIADPPLTLADPAVSLDGSGFLLNMQLDLPTAETSSVWAYKDDTKTSATVSFCARVDLYYESVFVNFVKAMTNISVQIGSGGFAAFNSQQSVATHATTTATSNVDLTYPVAIYPCDTFANMVAEFPTVLPGTAVRFCVALAQPDAAVFVSGIDKVTYHSSNPATLASAIENGAPLDSLAGLDCSFDGVCLVEFIPLASFFAGNGPLIVEGDAVVSFSNGSGPTRRRLRLAKQRVLTTSGDTESAFSFQVELGASHSSMRNEERANANHIIEEGAIAFPSSGPFRGVSLWCLSSLFILLAST